MEIIKEITGNEWFPFMAYLLIVIFLLSDLYAYFLSKQSKEDLMFFMKRDIVRGNSLRTSDSKAVIFRCKKFKSQDIDDDKLYKIVYEHPNISVTIRPYGTVDTYFIYYIEEVPKDIYKKIELKGKLSHEVNDYINE